MNFTTSQDISQQAIIALFEKQNFSDSKTRQVYLEQFLAHGFPSKNVEDYKFTPFDTTFERILENADLGISPLEKDQLAEFLNKEEGHHLIFIDGNFSLDLSTIQSDPGLVISSEESVDKLNTLSSTQDVFSSLNAAFVHKHAQIHVKKNKEALPVFIYHFVNATEDSFTNPRLTITSEEGAKLNIVEKTWVDGDNEAFINLVTEISVARNASINYCKLQNHHRNIIIHDGLKVKQERDSRFYSNVYTFSGKKIRNNIDISIDDENCESHMHGLYLLDGNTHVDNHTSVDHKVPNCFSNEVYKGIVDGKSRAVFNGKIFVRPNAQQTNAFQSNNNISLSDLATINTKPQLEIWADDVKCSHGCTIGQLDEEALFYLRTRGLDEKTAKSMMLIAFAEDTFEYIPFDFLKEEIDSLIQSRLG
jgi:Fe-S cluster assembly protein SufD